ncbi:MAG: GtrA family protein [Chitinophagia bacterium]
MKNLIESILDLFYPLFKKFMNRTTFRYAACGGANTVFDIFLFFISYNFILKKQYVELPFMVMSPHIAAFLLAFLVSFPIGFLLMRFIVFQDSYLKGRIQLFRYFLSVCVSLLMNYAFLKILVEKLHIYPTVSKIITTFFVVGFSYLAQKHFSFKTPKAQ